MSSMGGVSTTQKGAVAESIVAARLILDSGGRLAPYLPLADDRGIDLLVLDRPTGVAVPLQIKSRTGLVKGKSSCHFQVRGATFDRRALLLAVLLDLSSRELSIARAWLIPMTSLKRLAKLNTKGNYVIRPNPGDESNDMYQRYRCTDMKEVVRRIRKRCKR